MVIMLLGGSSEGLPDDENFRPFYALGVNVARQVGNDIKPLLSSAEMDAFLVGFKETMLNKVDEESSVLDKYGVKLNQILQERISELQKGQQEKTRFVVEQFMKSNPQSIKTTSGLIFCENESGKGAQASVNSTVEVCYRLSVESYKQ
jgi:FKBP-type peptidyl-prolyl cis-trans isomerase